VSSLLKADTGLLSLKPRGSTMSGTAVVNAGTNKGGTFVVKAGAASGSVVVHEEAPSGTLRLNK